MRANEFLLETGTEGGMNAGSVASVETPLLAKRGKSGKAPKQFKVKSVNATDSNVNIFGAVGENTPMPVIKR